MDKRTKEVSNCLEMLRSASGHDESVLKQHGTASNDWKVIYFLILDASIYIIIVVKNFFSSM